MDESGDPGFKLDQGSSKWFIVAMVLFSHDAAVTRASFLINQTRRRLGLAESYEFKFNKTSPQEKRAFFEAVIKCDFTIRAAVFDKAKVKAHYPVKFKRHFYHYAIRTLLEIDKTQIQHARIYVDTFGSQVFRQTLSRYLSDHLNTSQSTIMDNLIFKDSKYDNTLQLADMVAGALHRSYLHKFADADDFRELVRSKEDQIWVFDKVMHRVK